MNKNIMLHACLLGAGLCLTVPSSHGQGVRVHGYMHSTNVSEPVPIKANFDDWHTDDYQSGNALYSKLIARTGVGWNHWAAGVTHQHYYYLNFSADTARLHYLNENDRLDQFKGLLQLDLRANNVAGKGAYIAYQRRLGGFHLSATLSYVTLRNLMYGQADGIFDPREDFDNATRFNIDYAYHEDKLFDRAVTPPRGRGITADVALRWQKQNHQLDLIVEELYSRLEWKSAPASEVSGRVDTLDLDGAASVQFRHFHSHIRQYLPSHSRLKYTYSMSDAIILGASWEQLDQVAWRRLCLGWTDSTIGTVALSVAPEDNLWGLSYQRSWLEFAVESDELDVERSRVFNMHLALQWRF